MGKFSGSMEVALLWHKRGTYHRLWDTRFVGLLSNYQARPFDSETTLPPPQTLEGVDAFV